jgi:hypothetical protein
MRSAYHRGQDTSGLVVVYSRVRHIELDALEQLQAWSSEPGLKAA